LLKEVNVESTPFEFVVTKLIFERVPWVSQSWDLMATIDLKNSWLFLKFVIRNRLELYKICETPVTEVYSSIRNYIQ
jgi:hypothetical protein